MKKKNFKNSYILLFFHLILFFFAYLIISKKCEKYMKINISIFFLSFNNNLFRTCNSFPMLPKIYDQIEDITFLSVPFALNDMKKFMTTFISISSWLSISPKSHVILFIDNFDFDKTGKFNKEIEKAFGKNRISYAGPICTNVDNIPYINEWFIQGIKLSRSKYVTFINSDIILPSNWLLIAKKTFLHPRLKNKPLFLISKRLNLDITFISKIINFRTYKKSVQYLLKEIEKIILNHPNTTLSPNSAVDIFTFRADRPPFNPRDIPPFLMGKPAWDDWIVGYLNKISETITFGNYSFIYHIGPFRTNYYDNSPGYFINYYIYHSRNFYHGDNSNTKWTILNGFLRKNHGEIIFPLDYS